MLHSRSALGALALFVFSIGFALKPGPTIPSAVAAPPKPTCAAARALDTAGETEAAKKEYAAVLREQPDLACASIGLKALNEPPTEPAAKECEVGEALLKAHRQADAIEAFKSALKTDPKDDCATKGLEAAGPNRESRFIEGVTNSIPNILVALGLIILGVFGLLMFGYVPKIGRFLRKAFLAKLILRPRVDFEDVGGAEIDGKPGSAINARIKEKLTKMRDEAIKDELREWDLDLGRPREEFADLVSENSSLKTSLEKASDISEQTKLVAALLNLAYALLPIPRYQIGASLEPPLPTKQAALTVLLQKNSKAIGGTTLVGATPEEVPVTQPAAGGKTQVAERPNANDYVNLADPAAVWLQFEIAHSLKGELPDEKAAQSHALVLEGLELYEGGKVSAAIASYEQARQLNRRNWAAAVCLAVAEARLEENFARSIRHVQEALEEMRKDHAKPAHA